MLSFVFNLLNSAVLTACSFWWVNCKSWLGKHMQWNLIFQ